MRVDDQPSPSNFAILGDVAGHRIIIDNLGLLGVSATSLLGVGLSERVMPDLQLRIVIDNKIHTICRVRSTAKDLPQQAMRWQYRVRQRSRWSRNEDASDASGDDARETLKRFGIDDSKLDQLLESEWNDFQGFQPVEVVIPWTSENENWAFRIMPWEYLLTAATKSRHHRKKLLVIRWLQIDNDGRIPFEPPTSFSILVAAPGLLRDEFQFDKEIDLVRASLTGMQYRNLHNQVGSEVSVESLKKRFRTAEAKKTLLHVTGVDGQLGAQLLKLESVRDGLFLCSDAQGPVLTEAIDFARTIVSKNQGPRLVAYNLWNSGGRLAPLTVAAGAQASIGFQNTFDDGVAEQFFASFYQSLMIDDWNLLHSFATAILAIKRFSARIRGSSVVLWTRESLLGELPKLSEGLRSIAPVKAPHAVISSHAAISGIENYVRIEVEPRQRLNYAHLHNRGSLLQKLTLQLIPDGIRNANAHEDSGSSASVGRIEEIRGIEIEVSLSTGEPSLSFQTSVSLTVDEALVQLADSALEPTENHGAGGIHIPLTSSLLRSVDESMLTNVHVKVRWRDKTLFNRSYSVQLAPVDEWRFEPDQIDWMPSFVQPRDPAIPKIIESAQRYLACLLDDYSAGFDGYQSVGFYPTDPYRSVDAQVRAIWTALALDFQLKYINPPPGYSDNAQRLRTPSRILAERRGTCVDLALLIASCLEWIDIYPVIFNWVDHAFPGYWRNPAAYESFRFKPETKILEDASIRPSEALKIYATNLQQRQAPRSQSKPWCSDQSTYFEVRNYILPERKRSDTDSEFELNRSLIPMETTYLTNASGFGHAIEQARTEFAKERNVRFEAMIDVVHSRTWVTPIPLSSITARD